MIIVDHLKVLLLHLPHPYLFDRVAKVHELIRMRRADRRHIKAAVLAAQLNILPALRVQLLQTRVQVIVALIELEKSEQSIADRNKEGYRPRAPIVQLLIGGVHLDR